MAVAFRGVVQEYLLNSNLNVRMGKKGDLSNFERGMVAGAGVSISVISSVTGIFTHNHF